jgi:hypothetical protein
MLLAVSAPAALAQGRPIGTGISIDNLTGISLPLVGEAGDVIIDELIITDLKLVEDLLGQIVGLEVVGTITGTLTATGVELVDEQFTSTVAITSAGPGRCGVVGIDLGPLNIDVLGGLATVDVPEAEVITSGSGAVGTLLCTLGSLFSGVIGGVTQGVQGVVNALNRLI